MNTAAWDRSIPILFHWRAPPGDIRDGMLGGNQRLFYNALLAWTNSNRAVIDLEATLRAEFGTSPRTVKSFRKTLHSNSSAAP